MCGAGGECSAKNFLFSNTEAWRLYSAENRHSRAVNIFYIVWRWLWAVFFTTFIVLTGALNQSWYDGEDNRVKWFIYLTNWAFLVLCVSLLVNAAVTTTGFSLKELDPSIRWYMKLNWFMYEMASSTALLVAILFWSVIYMPGQILTVDIPVTHGVNGLFVLLDIWVTAMPIKVLHFYVPALFGLVYVLFSVIYAFSNGTNALLQPYIYNLLDWNEGVTFAATFSAGGIIGAAVSHFILFGIYKLRIFLYNKFLYNSMSIQEDDLRITSVEITKF